METEARGAHSIKMIIDWNPQNIFKSIEATFVLIESACKRRRTGSDQLDGDDRKNGDGG
jgi:hypothetical protein